MAKRTFLAGVTSQTIDVFIQDSSSTIGAGLSGLVFNTSGLKAYYRKGALGTPTAITLATLATVGTAWSSGGFIELDATNMKGVYRLDVPDTVFASTPYATVYLYGAANMAPVVAEFEIVAYNPFDAALGITNIAAIKAKTDNLPATPASTGDAMTLTSGERNSVADALLNRDMSTGTDSGSPTVRTVRQALRFLRNKWSISGTTLTVTKEDDATASWTSTVTTTSGAAPITANDPA